MQTVQPARCECRSPFPRYMPHNRSWVCYRCGLLIADDIEVYCAKEEPPPHYSPDIDPSTVEFQKEQP